METNRRDFFKKSALIGLSGVAGQMFGKDTLNNLESGAEFFVTEGTPFELPMLPYPYEALEPFIDKQTMEIHYSKHHKGYVDKLNAAATPQNINYKVDDAGKCQLIDASTSAAIRNNLGGHYNHSLFWTILKPNPAAKRNFPVGKLNEAINAQFKSFDEFRNQFSEKASKVFGSGWCWLIVDDKNNLKITTTPNQDNPLMKVVSENGKPILCIDIWEHAYYLKYQNKRADYIGNWWNIINWETAESLYTSK